MRHRAARIDCNLWQIKSKMHPIQFSVCGGLGQIMPEGKLKGERF
ncbi:MAG: hypothetical protein Q4B88_05240 [Moraxella sp.]|nr:hypothetical protein [Moraxella sp.]